MNANLFSLLRTHWSVAPDRQFLVPNDGPAITYREMERRVGQFATVLQVHGVNPGDRIVVQVTKSIDNVALYLASLQIGAVYVPLNTAYTAHEIDFFVGDAEPAIVVNDRILAELAEAASAAEAMTRAVPRLADDLAAMVYTSGTTGRSKGAMLTHGNLTSNALTLHGIWRFTPGDVLLHILPIYHVHGLFVALHTAMLNASTVFFCERFDVDAVLELLPQSSVMMGVPTHYTRLLDDPRLSPEHCASMRLFTSGSAPMTAQIHDAFTDRTGHRILERYGMTETGMLTSNPYDGDRVAGTVGFPLPGVRMRLVADDGTVCDPGDVGTVQVQGPNVFAGYWKLPDRTESEHDDGWFITGDVGTIDDEGRLTLEGRATDMIISGGLNVYPREIEMLLDDVDGVVESAVVGVPDTDLGERVEAYLVVEPGADMDVAALDDLLRERLAGFKVPKAIHAIDALPRNSMGKVQKFALRDRS